jgi:hypothetical protein
MAVSPSALQMHPFTSSKGAGVRAASTPRRRITSAPAHAGSLRAHKAPAAAGTTASKSSRTVSPSPMLNKQQGHHANTQVPQQLHSKGGSVESTGHAALQDPQQAVEVPGSAPQAEAAATQQQEAPGTSQEVETAAVSHKPTGKASDTGESSAEERAGDDATARWVARAQAAELQAAAAAAAAAEALARAPPPPVRTRREGPGGRSLSLASPPGECCSSALHRSLCTPVLVHPCSKPWFNAVLTSILTDFTLCDNISMCFCRFDYQALSRQHICDTPCSSHR